MTAAVPSWEIVGPRSADADLVRAAAAGDRHAFAVMYDRYSDRLHDFCAGMLADRDAAADCVQDAFCTAATCLSDLREPDKLRAWLYGIARHQALRRIRDRRREQLSDELPDIVSGDAGPDTMAARSELANLVAEAAGGLSDRDRAVLELAYRHGLDGPELAEALGVSQTNANTMVFRLRETIERCLGALLVARRARTDPNRCPQLASILTGWDGQFTILIRKRIARHVESCDRCEQQRRRMVNPVALLGAAPAFIPAPGWLRDRTLHDIQLTCAGTGMTSTAPPQRAPAAGGDVMWSAKPTLVDREQHSESTEDENADEDERVQRKLILLMGLFVGIPLAVLVVTIAWIYLPSSAVNPSGVTGPAPPATTPAPAGPLTTAPPPNAPPPHAPSVVNRSPSAPAVAPSAPRISTAPQPVPVQEPNELAPQPIPAPLPNVAPAPLLPDVLAPPLLPIVAPPPAGPAAPPPPPPSIALAPRQSPLPDVVTPTQQPTALAPAPTLTPSASQPAPGLGDSTFTLPEPVAPEPSWTLIPPPR